MNHLINKALEEALIKSLTLIRYERDLSELWMH